ncbi:TPA: hypothetical protein ACK3Q6_002620 [Burkholderia cepacia]|uniref:hypothetical protein n=1 Tax=Burkholderia cepacia TaxID=292 RepID=UPI001CF26030|nr:hypothetical protein [Burkholderia cepacia]HDR9764333.1 hypothetical protein [Burkholderia cepacia ATCC 25416]MCA8361271.1 hypothetical protein [Burkholderia cepacia]MDO5943374.1 hypothetical protein [Burkholderia cepacia]HDR9771335.1 hypothetical protein [Burkholderia cepacia ATCC 25416]HDR9780012.1 hypothetical protein [Burkholderia cepacia ATCC 25416]
MTNYKKKAISVRQDEIDLAISELRNSGQKVTVPAVSKLTGIGVMVLYSNKAMEPFIKTRKKPSPVVDATASIPPKATVDSYISEILENYFDRPETLNDVKTSFLLSNPKLNLPAFQQAINLLVKDKLITPHAAKIGAYVKTAQRSLEAPHREPIVVILNVEVEGESYTVFSDDKRIDEEIEAILKQHVDAKLTVFRPSEIIRTERKIIRERA